MAKRKELTVEVVVVSEINGQRVERLYDELSESEKIAVSQSFTDRFMEGAGYRRATEEELRA